MKKKIICTAAATVLSLCLCFSAACGGGKTSGGGGGGQKPSGPIEATIDMYTSVNIIEYEALQAAAQAYEDYQFDQGNVIHVQLHNTDDPDGLRENLVNMISNGDVKGPTVATISPLPMYHGTDKLVDLAGYLEEPNPYNDAYDTWKDSLEADAYRPIRAGGSVTTPGVSYSSNYACMFYNKKAMKAVMGDDPLVDETGTIDTASPDFNWAWMMKALRKAQEVWKPDADPTKPDEVKINYPLGISRNQAACGQDNFNLVTMLLNMYFDQYFRDFTEEVHSVEGDYSYIPGIDSEWTYDGEDAQVDYENKYSYNLNRIIDAYFNHSEEFGAESERYAEVLENLWDLLQFSNPTDAYQDCFDKFNRTTIRYSKGGYYGNEDMRLFYLETLGYIRTFRDAHKTSGENGTTYPSSEWIGSNLGWFLMPAMPSELQGVADNLRPAGGPLENYGALSTGSASMDEISVDFLRWLTSPLGQEHMTAKYVSRDAPQMMHQLVKGIVLDPKVDFTQVAMQVKGDIGFCPYNIFAMGSGMSTCTAENSATKISVRIAELLSDYFKGGDRSWTGGAAMLGHIRSGFASYAEQYHLIYNDPAKASEMTNGLKNNPFSATD